jgi:predicted lipoprotein with Yx(FWY)xxD motif
MMRFCNPQWRARAPIWNHENHAEGRRVKKMSTRQLVSTVGAAAVVIVVLLATLGVFTAKTTPKGALVSMLSTSKYGKVLIVGGKAGVGLGGFPLYEFSGDVKGHFGCGTTKSKGYDTGASVIVALTCTGPQRDLLDDVSSDDWPALTSKARPVAGPGVEQKLLGTIHRPGIGNQVTYAGHPLYLFDQPSSPFAPQGENFIETVRPLPPWHGYWYLVSSRTGEPAPGVATIEEETLSNGNHALAVEEDANVDHLAVTVYSSSGAGGSTCATTCALRWSPVLSSAVPNVALGVDASKVGVIPMASGLFQVTFDGHPLYLYAKEKVLLRKGGRIDELATAGNGASVAGPGGAMSVVPTAK